MNNKISVIIIVLISAWLVSVLACGSSNVISENSANSANSNKANETTEAKPTPSATPFSFDSEKLLAYTKINQSESEKIIKDKEILVTGPVISADSYMNRIKFYSRQGAIWCEHSEVSDELKKSVDQYFDSKSTNLPPSATIKGIYTSADVGKSEVTIYLDKCVVMSVR